MKALFFAGIMVGWTALPVHADEPPQKYIDQANRAWALLECSMLASKSGRADATKSLGARGLAEAREYVDAARAGEFNSNQILGVYPSFMGVLYGPSTDFVLGGIVRDADTLMTEFVIKDDRGNYVPVDRQRGRADMWFKVKNCDLLR